MHAKWLSALLVLVASIVAMLPVQTTAATTDELNRMVLTLAAKVELLQEQNSALQDQLVQAKVELALAQEKIAAFETATPNNHAQLNTGTTPAEKIVMTPVTQVGSTTVESVPASSGQGTRQLAALEDEDTESDSDWYLSGSLSGAISEEIDISASTAPPTTAKASLDPGFGVQVAVGNQVSQWFRLEGEASYRRFGIDSFNNVSDPFGAAIPRNSASGYVDLFTFFANAYADGPDIWNITPYVGAGVGGFLGCVPGGGVRATSLRHSSPVEVTSSFRGDCHRSVLMMAQSGQGFQGHVSS